MAPLAPDLYYTNFVLVWDRSFLKQVWKKSAPNVATCHSPRTFTKNIDFYFFQKKIKILNTKNLRLFRLELWLSHRSSPPAWAGRILNRRWCRCRWWYALVLAYVFCQTVLLLGPVVTDGARKTGNRKYSVRLKFTVSIKGNMQRAHRGIHSRGPSLEHMHSSNSSVNESMSLIFVKS